MKAIQIEADEEEKAAIEAYERWQIWQQEWALQQIEEHVRSEETREWRLSFSLSGRVLGWAMVATPILIGIALYLVWRTW